MDALIAAKLRNRFTLFDRDGDGRITKASAFTRLDRDGDGRISRDELAQAFEEYFTGTDRDLPGNWLYGPVR
ncbi:EF-hand domain-containing protein [Streptomyces sp. NBC_00347]|uniref:EF-hand domain-containing protein n=1 Tax=Streptomyces sp. NBC_00347 TaxID=2975721 RepID=UPI0022555DCC|nr:EF-hand domain-containing protein [Streptomyces sp. NBC_00347]MCX5127041.1 EF-hand domain-containing protein [Streptomyces sp. NBC_00347]